MRVLSVLAILTTFSVASKFEYVKPVSNELYQKECGSCHIAYQLELLPKETWLKIMDNLKDHFGEDATFNPVKMQTLREFLQNNTTSDLKPTHSLRITEASWFIKEHKKIPKHLITQKEVKSLSFCQTCHIDAEKGDYSEKGIFIPNYGRFHD